LEFKKVLNALSEVYKPFHRISRPVEVNLVRLINAVGILPTRLLPLNLREVNVVSCPNVDGTLPESLFFDKSSWVMAVRPVKSGIAPVNLLVCSQR